jgi:hypothetical protein
MGAGLGNQLDFDLEGVEVASALFYGAAEAAEYWCVLSNADSGGATPAKAQTTPAPAEGLQIGAIRIGQQTTRQR